MDATETSIDCDANKTPLTARVTAAAQLWLNERGFKPVETEVSVSRGWCADLAGVAMLTRTEAINLKLIGRKPVHCRFTTDAAWQAWADAFDRLPGPLTALVEAKTSRGDFRGDRKWTAALPTHLAYVATPPGLIEPEEVPAGWGWLVCGEKAARQARPAALTAQDDRQTLLVTHAIAERRDNTTRYERLRSAQKRFTAQQAEARGASRMSDVLRCVRAILIDGKPIEEACRWHGLKLRDWQLKNFADDIEKIRQAAIPAPTAPNPETKAK